MPPSQPLSLNAPSIRPIVGRERERTLLRAFLDDASAGRGRLLLLGGDAGIGKTTLVDWLAEEALRVESQVLWGGCYDLTLTPPLGPWREALARLHSPLRDDADLEALGSQSLLLSCVRDFLGQLASSRPLLLVLEDLHWSDPASLELLRRLTRRPDPVPALVVATYRTDELSRRSPLAQYLPLLVRESRAERIDLAALSDNEASEVVAGTMRIAGDDEPRLMRYLQLRTGGNPLFLTEVLRTLVAERLLRETASGWVVGDLDRASVPPLVKQVIERRLVHLDEPTLQLLEVGAVIGQELPVDLWQLVAGADGETLHEAVDRARDARLLDERPGVPHVVFRHALVRAALYERQARSQRQELHRRVAEHLLARTDPPAGAIAMHFERAGDRRALDWYARAGEHALGLYATADAVDALTRAHEMAGRLGIEMPAAAYRMRAAAYAMSGTFEPARRDYEIVLQRARTTGDRLLEWQALVDLGMLWQGHDYHRAGELCNAALNLARAMDDQHLIATSLNLVANWYVNLDEPERALPLHREALVLCTAAGNRRGVADTLDLLGMANYLRCNLAASTTCYEQAIPLYRELGDLQRLAASLTANAFNGADHDGAIGVPALREPPYWLAQAEEGLALARRIRWSAGEALALLALAVLANSRGELGRALSAATEGVAVAERIGHYEWIAATDYAHGVVAREQLDCERALAALESGLSAARRSGSRFWIATLAASLASARIAVGDLHLAAATLNTVEHVHPPRPSMGRRQCSFVRAELELARGAPERALGLVQALVASARDEDEARASPQLLKLQADIQARLGNISGADASYRAARDECNRLNHRPLVWRIEAARGRLLATDQPQAAEQALSTARAMIETLAATIEDSAACAAFRARALATLPPATGFQPRHPLSERELEVLRLLVDGRTDREIADALFISPRTVMRHVASILNKLGVSSRTAAASVAIRQRLV